MKELTNAAITSHSEQLSMKERLHKLNAARQVKKATQKEKPILEGFVTLEEFMTNLLNEIHSRYENKDNNH
jgi:flagellar basal body-associated protein FliL